MHIKEADKRTRGGSASSGSKLAYPTFIKRNILHNKAFQLTRTVTEYLGPILDTLCYKSTILISRVILVVEILIVYP